MKCSTETIQSTLAKALYLYMPVLMPATILMLPHQFFIN